MVPIETLRDLQRLFLNKRLRLALAESCTGGALSAAFTLIPGSSQYFQGGIIAYSNMSKMNLLGVDKAQLDRYSAVSPEVAQAMAKGALKILEADIALSTTGLAGPEKGEEPHPIGTVFVAIESRDLGAKQYHLQLKGDRIAIIQQTVEICLQRLIEFMTSVT